MINLSQTNLIGMTRNEVVDIAKQEVQEYKEARQYNQVYQNIPRLKNLEAIDRRLGAFALGDEEVISIRAEVKQLLNEDVYEKQAPKEPIQTFSSAEAYINARLRSK